MKSVLSIVESNMRNVKRKAKGTGEKFKISGQCFEEHHALEGKRPRTGGTVQQKKRNQSGDIKGDMAN
jgi:hypothetical protein